MPIDTLLSDDGPAAAPIAQATSVDLKDAKWSPLDPKNPKGPQMSVSSGALKSGPG